MFSSFVYYRELFCRRKNEKNKKVKKLYIYIFFYRMFHLILIAIAIRHQKQDESPSNKWNIEDGTCNAFVHSKFSFRWML